MIFVQPERLHCCICSLALIISSLFLSPKDQSNFAFQEIIVQCSRDQRYFTFFISLYHSL